MLLLTHQLHVAPHIGIMFPMPHEAIHMHEVGNGKDEDGDHQRHNKLKRHEDQAQQAVQEVDWDTPATLLPPIHVFVLKVHRLEEEGREYLVQGTYQGD